MNRESTKQEEEGENKLENRENRKRINKRKKELGYKIQCIDK